MKLIFLSTTFKWFKFKTSILMSYFAVLVKACSKSDHWYCSLFTWGSDLYSNSRAALGKRSEVRPVLSSKRNVQGVPENWIHFVLFRFKIQDASEILIIWSCQYQCIFCNFMKFCVHQLTFLMNRTETLYKQMINEIHFHMF